MTDATYPVHHLPSFAPNRSEAASRPAPVRCTPPVFISDCVTPLGGETLLSVLWRRLDHNG